MRTIIAFIIGLVLAVLIGAAPTNAGSLAQGFNSICGDRKTVIDHLEKTYGEAPVSMGLAANGSVIEVIVSPEGTWTIILTQPSGITCVMAAGESWENVPEKPKGPKI